MNAIASSPAVIKAIGVPCIPFGTLTRLDLVSLDDYLKGKTSTDGGSGSEGGGSDSDGDQGENPLG